MKKLIILTLLLAAKPIFSQPRERGQNAQLTAEQRTTLMVKKMQLELELDEGQLKEMTALLLDQNQKMEQRKKKRDEDRAKSNKISQEERFNKKNEALDEEIVFQSKVKKILTEQQYAKWQAGREERKDKIRSHLEDRRELKKEQKGRK